MAGNDVLIVGGTGAVGGALTAAAIMEASHLHSGNAPVTIVGSGRHTKPAGSLDTLQIIHREGDGICYQVEYLTSDRDTSAASTLPPIRCVQKVENTYDTIYVTVKSGSQNAELAQRVIDAAKPEANIVVVANGFAPPLYLSQTTTETLADQEAFYKRLGESDKKLHVFQGIFMPGVKNVEEPSIHRRIVTISKPRPDETFFYVGSFNDNDTARAGNIAASLNHDVLQASAKPDIVQETITKLMINRSNLLCAVTGRDKNTVFKTEQCGELFKALSREELAIFTRLGFPQDNPEGQIDRLLTFAQKAPNHNTSTLTDLQNGVTRTERPALSGVMVELGNKLGVDVPVTREIDRILARIEPLADKSLDPSQKRMRQVQNGVWESIMSGVPLQDITDGMIENWLTQKAPAGQESKERARQ